jgi:beta-lactamase regulating signal transducer with metallopeptidase domain
VLTALTGHRPVSNVVGLASALATVVLVVRAVRTAWRINVERRRVRSNMIALNNSSESIALAVPGSHGGVVLSRGLRSRLTRQEIQVVIAHEQAHLRHRHHRHLATSAVCASALPVLHRLNENLRYAVERWADEDVAASIGSRRFVAHTIARAALQEASPSTIPALTEVGVAARVEALLSDVPAHSGLVGAAIVTNATIAGSGMTASALQLHHLGLL